jgi:gliding motility-associated-like protein
MRFSKIICLLFVSLLSGYSVIVRGQTISVAVNGSSFCEGQTVLVSYTVSNTGGSFDNSNVFTAQLSDASGNFSSPVDIGILNSKESGEINAIIPPGTIFGTQYRIRVVSSNPVITSDPDGTDLTINNLPSAPILATATPDTICALATLNLAATSEGNSIQWYTTDAGGSPLGISASGANFPVAPAVTTTYYAESLNSAGCSSQSRTMITVTVNQIPSITSTTPGFVCGSGTVTLGASSAEGIINWYSDATGGVIAGTGISFTTPILNSNTTYYVDATANGCTTVTRTAILATVASIPSAPLRGTRTQPTCAVPTGSVILNNLPGTGTWTLTRTPGGITTTGTGTSTTITGLAPGTYTYTVTNEAGCTSSSSSNIVINAVPASPSVPTAGTRTQPTCTVPTGSVVLNNLPAQGTWTLIRTPGGATATGTGTSTTITGLAPGTYTYTVTNASGCTSSSSSDIVINAIPGAPPAPVPGTISQPTCTVSTGSVVINNLPSTGTWTLTRSPGGTTTSGTGSSRTITGLAPGTYTYTVTDASGCISSSSSNIVINSAPALPSAPSVGTRTQPTCAIPTGSVVLNNLPATDTWTLIRTPGGATTIGTGTTTTITGLAPGTYTFTVTNASGCTSSSSSNIVINAVPASPSAPNAGTRTQPTCSVPTGSVVLNNLPGTGTWTLTRNPGGITTTGTGTRTTVTGLPPGTYTYTVTNEAGCTSSSSSNIVINAAPGLPPAPAIGLITQPTCAVATGSVILNNLPATGTWTLTRTPGAIITSGTGISTTIAGLPAGTYTYTVSVAGGCPSLPSGNVVINAPLPSPGVPTYTVDCTPGFGHAIITVTSPSGAGFEYTLDGGVYQTGNVFNEVANGDHYLAVRNAQGCTTAGGLFAVSCACGNSPTLTLGSVSGSTCGTSSVTVTGNTFGGNSTSVTISENGAGSVSPASSGTSPFTFTYTPAPEDGGRTVVITVTTNNPAGLPCAAATGTYTLTVNATPSPPVIGAVTSLTCTAETGSVALNGLPSTGTWTLTRNPGGITTNGTGSATTVSGLDAGTYSFTVASAAGCISEVSANAVINPQPPLPSAPVTGTITQPTCALSTGSIILNGLPATGTWTLTRSPGGITVTGSGTSSTISAIPAGTYTFTVTNSSGCISLPSEKAVINAQPPTPTAPLVGLITRPSCTLATGSVNLSGLPSSGTWTLTRYPGSVTTNGTGTSRIISGLAAGTYNYSVTNSAGCISQPSANVVIPVQPPTPAVPVIENVVQPTYNVPTGSVIFSGLPSSGTWIITRLPDRVTKTGTGNSYTFESLPAGSFTFTLTNSFGCISLPTDAVRISVLGPPDIIITDPSPVCAPATVDLTAPEITAGSTSGLEYTYWTDEEAKTAYNTPSAATAGTYYIKGTTLSDYFNIKPVIVTIDEIPVANAGPDQTLFLQYSTTLAAELNTGESGIWSLRTGTGEFSNDKDPQTTVSKLAFKNNILFWTVTKGVCPPVTDSVTITVSDIIVPTLITPNGDQMNEYFEIQGIEALGKTELIVFDRRGAMMFKDSNYDNKWNGVDYNDNLLPDDTYFYVLKSSNGLSKKGFVVIRR